VIPPVAFTGLVALCLTPGVGGVTLHALLERFGDVETILRVAPDVLQTVPGVGPAITQAIQAINLDRTAIEIERWQATGITLLTQSHLRYPALLAALRDAPPLLFCRGQLPRMNTRMVAIVGTRHPTPAGQRLAEQAGRELARRGWTVVSGLAWGIDMAAHQGALQEGASVAVLGAGLDSPQPPAKVETVERLVAGGALLSELHPSTAPSSASLVARNRIISGMCRGVIVIEAGEQSGSLYTARFAFRQKRAIFAVDNGLAGNARLLATGAARLDAYRPDWHALAETLEALPG
jgi:DNA processing protein